MPEFHNCINIQLQSSDKVVDQLSGRGQSGRGREGKGPRRIALHKGGYECCAIRLEGNKASKTQRV